MLATQLKKLVPGVPAHLRGFKLPLRLLPTGLPSERPLAPPSHRYNVGMGLYSGPVAPP